MKILYLDCFAGISGDMFLGAMLDLGLSPRVLRAELAKLSIPRASGNAAPPQKPLKEIIRSASRPSAEVNTDDSAAPPQDPMVRVLANIKAGVKGAQAEYNRLKNEADLRKRKGR